MNGCMKYQFYEKITKVISLSCIFISLFTKKYQVAASRNRKFNSNFVCGQTWIIVKVCVSRNLDFVARRTIDCSNSLFVSFFPPFSPKWGKAWGGQCAHILEMEQNEQVEPVGSKKRQIKSQQGTSLRNRGPLKVS